MGVKGEMIELAVISAVMIALSVIGIIWDVVSRLLFSGVDGLLLLATCLLFGGLFSLMLFITLRQMRALHAQSSGAAALPAPPAAAAPAAKPLTAAPAAKPDPGHAPPPSGAPGA